MSFRPLLDRVAIRRPWMLSSTLMLGISTLAAALTLTAPRALADDASKYGGTLIVGQIAEITTLDPGREGGWETFTVSRHIHESLVTEDLTHSGSELKAPPIKPGLAESWEISPDGRVYTFHLRHGVKFQDRSDFNAAAVAFNVRRSWDPKFEFFDKISASNLAYTYSSLKSVETPDDSTVVFTFSQPFSPLLRMLAQGSGGSGGIASPDAIRKYGNDGYAEHPVGTGPYRFVERVRGQKVELAKFDGYWGKKPYLNRIIFRPIPDGAARVAALETGEVDIIDWPPRDSVAKLKSEGLTVDNVDLPSVYYYSFNSANKTFEDPRVRQALILSVDRVALARDLLKGTAAPAYGLLNPGSDAYDPSFRDYPYDVEKAKQLLRDAGHPDGVSGELDVYAGGEPVAEWIQRDAAKAGIKLDVHSYDWNSFLAREHSLPPDVALTSMEWGFLTPYWLYIAASSQSGGNSGHYQNADFDKTVSNAITSVDPEAVRKKWQEANRILAEDAGKFPIYYDRTHYAVGKNVRGFAEAAQDWFDLNEVWLAEKQ